MIFSSKTPRDLNYDPEPFLDERWSRWIIPVTFQPRTFTYSPRPEFDHVQHNEPNLVLSDARIALRQGISASEILRRINYSVSGAGHYITLNWERITDRDMIDHARRVLTRLANLTKEN